MAYETDVEYDARQEREDEVTYIVLKALEYSGFNAVTNPDLGITITFDGREYHLTVEEIRPGKV